jgi:hypothetical protein
MPTMGACAFVTLAHHCNVVLAPPSTRSSRGRACPWKAPGAASVRGMGELNRSATTTPVHGMESTWSATAARICGREEPNRSASAAPVHGRVRATCAQLRWQASSLRGAWWRALRRRLGPDRSPPGALNPVVLGRPEEASGLDSRHGGHFPYPAAGHAHPFQG